MKWWGWGEEDVSFTHEGKPELAPFIERVLGLDVRRPGTSAIAFEDREIPAAVLPAGLRADLEDAVRAGQVSTDDRDRVVHGRGKSLTDLVRQRRGDLGRLNRVLWVDATSQLARVQAGVFGPDLERQLNAQGWTCGHFP